MALEVDPTPWIVEHWDIRECYIVTLTGDTERVGLLDSNIQSIVATGTKKEIFDWCQTYATANDLDALFGLDAIALRHNITEPLSDMDMWALL